MGAKWNAVGFIRENDQVIKKMTRRIWRKDRHEGQKKTIEYMKELGKRGHWVHVPRNESGKLTECTLKKPAQIDARYYGHYSYANFHEES